MELFAIHCTTCRARLKVQNESVIGEILSCPKCGSMVQVVPPADWHGNGRTVGTTVGGVPSENGSTKGATAGLPSSASLKAPTMNLSPSEQKHSGMNGNPKKDIPARAAAVAAATAPAVIASPPPVPDVPPPPAAPQLPPAAAPMMEAASAGTAKWPGLVSRLVEDKWLYGGALAVGTAVGIAAWIALVARGTVGEATPVQESAAVTQELAAQPAVSKAAPAVEDVPAAEAEQKSEKPEPSAEVAGDSVPLTPDPSPARGEGSNQVVSQPAVQIAPQPPSAPIEVTAAKPAAADPFPAAVPPAAKEAAPVVDPPPSTPLLTPDQIEGRLGDRMLAIEFTAVPLGQFVEFLSGFSTLPIVLDREGLSAVGKGAASPVTVKLARASVADALTVALTQHSLVYVVRDGRVIITAARAK